jgi:hypothetical protein
LTDAATATPTPAVTTVTATRDIKRDIKDPWVRN